MFKLTLADGSVIKLASVTEHCNVDDGLLVLSMSIDDSDNTSIVKLAKEIFTPDRIKHMVIHSGNLKVGVYDEFTTVDNIRRDIEPSGRVNITITFSAKI